MKFTVVTETEEKTVTEITETWTIKNNSNTNLAEVLAGHAVFVYDSDSSNLFAANHAGVTNFVVANDGQRRFDFVQELLNQVVPRKRSVTGYNLIDEDGAYYNGTQAALRVFKDNFNVNNQTINANMNSLNKLMRDYDKSAAQWVDRIVDKETLVGVTQRAQDNTINTMASGDTGLYELYVNVVSVFVEAMINEGERYGGTRGAPVPTSNWYARTGEGPTATPTLDAHGPGMSYCFGCKDSIADFNDSVAPCQANSTIAIQALEDDGIANNEYRGNLGNDCAIGSGNLDWAGLIDTEYYLQIPPFYTTNWAGIDCSGFVQRVVHTGRNAVQGVTITIPAPNTWINSQAFFTNSTRVLYMPNPANTAQRIELLKKLRRGDLIRYDGHITIFYSKPTATGSYEIIHASGSNQLCYSPGNQCSFNRKVVINNVNGQLLAAWLRNPNGFGRIKIWD